MVKILPVFYLLVQHYAYLTNYAHKSIIKLTETNLSKGEVSSSEGMVVFMTLNQLKTGQYAVITDVGGTGALRCRLLDMGLIPKTKVMIRKVAPMGDPIELFLRGYELTIRLEDAEKITVSPIEQEVAAV